MKEQLRLGAGFSSVGVSQPCFSQENRSMLFLGIDQHARPLTVSLRDQSGDVLNERSHHCHRRSVRLQ